MENISLIDNHTHGAYGVNFNYCSYSELKFVLRELYKRNIKGICATLVGESEENIKKQLSLFKKIKEEQINSSADETFIIGAHLEGTFLSPNRAGIQDKNTFKKPSIENFKKIAEGFEDIIKIVTIAPEENIDLIDYLNDKNIKTQAGHTLGASIKNCKGTTHHFNAMNSIHHRNPSIALQGLIRDDIYCEVIADLIHLSEDILKLILKTKPKDKIMLISDSLPCAHFDREIIFCEKKIDKEGKDEKGVLAGSVKTLDEITGVLVEKGILKKEEVREFAFENQIKYLNLKNSEVDILNS